MADQKLTQLAQATGITLDEIIYMVKTPSGTPASKKATYLQLAELYAGSVMAGSTGILLNGRFAVTVASNNLTVELKTLDGSTPSATMPVYVILNGALRVITSALSVTKNAATNWFNSGGSAWATIARKYYVYLGWNAIDGVTIGFSPVPLYGAVYSSFSATSTNDTYCAISTITNAAASDEYECIGRFVATLSAGAGYTWSVPAFNAANLVQHPTFHAPAYVLAAQGGNESFNPADGTTYYFGMGYALPFFTTVNVATVPIPKTGVITRIDLTILIRTLLGSAETSTIYFRLNNSSDTTLTTAANLSASSVIHKTGLAIAVVEGDTFEIKWVTPTWATNPQGVVMLAQVFVEAAS